MARLRCRQIGHGFVQIRRPAPARRVRSILTHQRTQLSNALRSHLAEFGIVSPIGREGLDRLLAIVADTTDERVPLEARASLNMLAVQLEGVKVQLLENDRQITAS